MIEVHEGDAAKILPGFDDESVHLVVTSPPYDDLRTYGKGEAPAFDFDAIAGELLRVLVPGGLVCWVVGNQVKKWNESLTAERQRIRFQELGFSVRKMIYEKNGFSAPNHTYYHRMHEDVTLACKGTKGPRVFHPIEDVPCSSEGALSEVSSFRDRKGHVNRQNRVRTYGPHRKRGDVWKGNTASQEHPCQANEHPALMPKWLARDLILSWSDPADVILDPFGGSGTTGKLALELGRRAVLIELNGEYVELMNEGLARVMPGLPL